MSEGKPDSVGIELMRVIKKGQMVGLQGSVLSGVERFYTVASPPDINRKNTARQNSLQPNLGHNRFLTVRDESKPQTVIRQNIEKGLPCASEMFRKIAGEEGKKATTQG